MWTRDFNQTGSRIALLIGQFLILLFCIGYINYIYFVNIYPDKRAKEDFLQTNCTLVSEKLSAKGRLIHKYRADFYITYAVNNVQYGRWVSGNGLDYSYMSNRAAEEDMISQFQEGNSYPCWYDPEDPGVAILVMRHSWTSTFPLFIPSVVALLAFYYFLKNLFLLMGTATIKAREIRQIRKEKKKKNVKTTDTQ